MNFMRFFDLANFTDDALGGFGKRLGYEKIFSTGKDVEIIDVARGDSQKRKIVMSDSAETVAKELKQGSVIGIMPKGTSVSGKTLDAIKNNEKLLFLAVSQVTCAAEGFRMQNLARARSLARSAMMSKVPIAIVSMAEDREGLMSSLQMLEVASFLGLDHTEAKEALNVLGGLL